MQETFRFSNLDNVLMGKTTQILKDDGLASFYFVERLNRAKARFATLFAHNFANHIAIHTYLMGLSPKLPIS